MLLAPLWHATQMLRHHSDRWQSSPKHSGISSTQTTKRVKWLHLESLLEAEWQPMSLSCWNRREGFPLSHGVSLLKSLWIHIFSVSHLPALKTIALQLWAIWWLSGWYWPIGSAPCKVCGKHGGLWRLRVLHASHNLTLLFLCCWKALFLAGYCCLRALEGQQL